MKKFLFLASAAALLATSCSDDFAPQGKQDLQVEGDAIVTATLNFGEEESGTRTTLGSNYQYYWNQGDQIGVFGAAYGLNVQNVPFIYPYATSATSGNFVGSANLLGGEGYFAYYPWTATDNLDAEYAGTNSTSLLSSFTLSNSATQNFNDAAQASAAWSTQRATGSFAPNAAPAYAYGVANANGTVSFSFQPLYSYLVFPITSDQAVNVSSIQLSIQELDETENNVDLPLVQSCTVKTAALSTNVSVEWNEPSQQNSNTITLLCSGNGVALGPSLDPVNFWFVVPAGLNLRGATVTLAVTTKKGDSITRTRTLDTNWSGSGTQNGVTQSNNVVWLWQTQGQPFTLNTNNDQYVINTAAQFLEYAYLVTYGLDGVYNGTSTDGVSNNNGWKNLTNYSLTDLQNMIYGTGYNGDLKTYLKDNNNSFDGLSVKQGVINGTLDLAPSVIKSNFASNSLTNVAQQAGYYTYVYGNYVYNNAPIASIGNGADFTLGGVKGSVATITGLRTSGAIFANMTDNAGTIQYLNIQNCNAQAWTEITNSSGYRAFLCATPSANATFSNVTVGANNIGTNLSSSSTSKLISLYGVLDNANAKKWSGAANNAFTYYANTLNVTTTSGQSSNARPTSYAFDFTATKGAAVSNFITIQYSGTQTNYEGSLFIVSGMSEATTLMNNFKNNNIVYSVIDRVNGEVGTSYWTGLPNLEPVSEINTAEYLAYIVNNGKDNTIQDFQINANLNLMGNYIKSNQYARIWKVATAYSSQLAVTTYKDSNTGTSWNQISNIRMSSSADGQILTLFGGASYIPSLVQISDMTVNVNNAECFVAAVSCYPYNGNNNSPKSNVSVENFTVNVASGLNSSDMGQNEVVGAVGGLYQNLDLNQLKLIGSQSSYTYGSVPAGINAGILAGVCNFALTTPTQLTIPYVGPSNAFGIVNVNVTGQPQNSSFLKVLKANSNIPDNWMNWNYLVKTEINVGYSLYVTDATAQYLKLAQYVEQTVYNEEVGGWVTTYVPGFSPYGTWSTVSPQVSAPSNYTPY